MRFLLDANLSPLIAAHLRRPGHLVAHVRELGLRSASDEEIMDFAEREGFMVVSPDSDSTGRPSGWV
jgi:predicted nuclease of predicted toxin-antitoxin system